MWFYISTNRKNLEICVTFVDVVNEDLLTRGRQHTQDVEKQQVLGVGVRLPGVGLEHVEESSQQVEHTLVWTVLQGNTHRVQKVIGHTPWTLGHLFHKKVLFQKAKLNIDKSAILKIWNQGVIKSLSL